ncbi:MAG: lipopolysaccharide heptosyltransferase II [Candidatus Firestonebacteria bacterium]
MGINKKEIKKILIRGVNWIGDSVITIPVVRTIRENFPDAFIGIIVKESLVSIWENVPYVNKVYMEKVGEVGKVKDEKSEIKNQKFDLGIIFPTSFSSALKMCLLNVKYRVGYPTELRGVFLTHKVPLPEKFREKYLLEEYFDIIRFIDLEIKDKLLEFFIPDNIRNKMLDLLKDKGFSDKDFIVGICPGATFGPAKMWFKERYADLITKVIKTYNAKIIIIGSAEEKELMNFLLQKVNLNDKILISEGNILESSALISCCKLFISNDTGPMHIAASLKIPVIAIFGSTNLLWTFPLNEESVVLYEQIDCNPCYKRKCKRTRDKYECFNLISVDEVMDAIAEKNLK